MAVFKFAFVAGAALLLAAPVVAQNRIIVEQGNGAPRQENSVRVQDNISLFLPGPTGDGDEAQKLREKGRRIVYEMAARECDLLREVLAKECRVENINVTSMRQVDGSSTSSNRKASTSTVR